MESRLNFKGMISYQNNQMVKLKKKILCTCFIKTVTKMNLLALSGIKMKSYYARSHSFSKTIIIFMVFFMTGATVSIKL